MKKHGEVIWNFANGRDVSVAETVPADNKGYGNFTTTSFDITDSQTAKKVLLSLTETIGKRLRRDQVRIRGYLSVSDFMTFHIYRISAF